MKVNIIMAPAGSGSKVVRFAPRVCAAEVGSPEELKGFLRNLSAQYSTPIYFDVNKGEITPEIIDGFSKYVESREIKRVMLRRHSVMEAAYDDARKFLVGGFRLGILAETMCRNLNKVVRSITEEDCKGILRKSVGGKRPISMDEFAGMVEQVYIGRAYR